jgi:hypothetical protein
MATATRRRRRPAVSPERRPGPQWHDLETSEEFVKALLYGDPGTGKTTAMAGMAHLGQVRIVNAEGGLKRTALKGLGIPTERIRWATVANFDDMDALIWELRETLDREPSGSSPDALAGVVLDTMTEIEAIMVGMTIQEQVERVRRRGGSADPFATEPDYVRNAQQMRRIVRSLRDLPCHVGFTAHPRRDQDEEGVVMYRPALTPQIAGLLTASVDISVAMQPVVAAGKKELIWGITRRRGKWYGKDRFRVLPARMPYPSFDRIVAYVRGDLTARTDPAVQEMRAIREGG